jgi:hypothetical protein
MFQSSSSFKLDESVSGYMMGFLLMGFNPHPIVRLDGSPKCLKQLLTSLCFNPQPNITLVVNKIQDSSLSWNDVSILSHPERWMYAEFNLYMEALYGFNPHPIINWMGKLAHLY